MAYPLFSEPNPEGVNLPRRERKDLQQRGEILDAALRLFSEKGYHNVSMHQIAKEAEFGIGTLYKYFNNKEELYKAIILRGAEKFHHALLQVLDQERDPLLAIKKHIAVCQELFLENMHVARLYFAETRGAGFSIRAGFDRELLERHDEFIEKLASVFERGVKENVFRALDPYQMALALDGLINAFHFRMIEECGRLRKEDDLSTVVDIFFGGVLNK